MPSLTNKIDFAVIFSAKNANPNGDPLNGNRPRQNYDGFGEVSDVCLKRKLRNRLLAMNKNIFVQSDENRNDEHRSLNARFEEAIKDKKKDKNFDVVKFACEKWFDVRAFGQVFAFKEKKGDADGDSGGVSIGIRGPVTIQSAFSIEPITTESLQITKSVNLETNEKQPEKKGSDTIGMKHRVDKAVYVAYGAINTQLASKTGFSDDDSEKIKEALRTLFVDDASSARPEGSMEVLKVIWWKHNSLNGQYSSAKVHRSLKVNPNGTYKLENFVDLIPEEIDGE
jgi:CRISPR-associated protein Csd2